ncbi:ankyrin repeat-containing domain protein, partial [Baffinella frigidus]
MALLLLQHGADFSTKDARGSTPLLPSSRRSIHVVQILLDKGADINSNNHSMKTPVMAAAHRGKSYFVQLLLKQGAVVTAEDIASAE